MAKTNDTPQEDTQPQEQPKKWYVVLHNAVASWWQGQRINEDHLKGHDVDRLIALGAIAPEGSVEHIEAAKDGLATETPEGTSVSDPVKMPEPKTETPADPVLPPGTSAATTVTPSAPPTSPVVKTDAPSP